MLLEGRSAKAMTQLMSLLDSVLAFAGLTTPLSDMLTRLIKLKEAKEHQATASGELRAALDDTVQVCSEAASLWESRAFLLHMSHHGRWGASLRGQT